MKFHLSISVLVSICFYTNATKEFSYQQQILRSNNLASHERTPGTFPDIEERQMMLNIINQAFKDVPMTGGGYLEYPNSLEKIPSWTSCSKIDSSAFCLNEEKSLLCDAKAASDYTLQALQSLHLESCFPGAKYAEDPTCKAFWATVKAYSELTIKMPAGPAFANYNAVGWTSKTVGNYTVPPPEEWGPFDSWVPGGFDPKSKTWKGLGNEWGSIGGNSAASWSLCDVVFNVLKQNNNQVGGSTCGPTAVLASLSRREPSYAMRILVELIWTGTLSDFDIVPCETILDQFPGLVPIPDPSSMDCDDAKKYPNRNDCLNAMGQPLNAVGTQQTFVYSMISASFNSVSNGCDDMNQKDIALTTPDNAESWKAIQNSQETVGAQVAWMATKIRHALDGDQLTFHIGNPTICNGLNIDLDTCNRVTSMQGLIGPDAAQLKVLMMSNIEASGTVNWEGVVEEVLKTDNLRLHAFVESLSELSNKAGVPVSGFFDAIVASMGAPYSQLHVQDDIIESACRSNHALMFIAADNLNVFQASKYPGIQEADQGEFTVEQLFDHLSGVSYTPTTCNHWVFLENCPEDLNDPQGKFDVWSWGESGYNMSKTILASMVCGFVF